jgi:hypothetical protein
MTVSDLQRFFDKPPPTEDVQKADLLAEGLVVTFRDPLEEGSWTTALIPAGRKYGDPACVQTRFHVGRGRPKHSHLQEHAVLVSPEQTRYRALVAVVSETLPARTVMEALACPDGLVALVSDTAKHHLEILSCDRNKDEVGAPWVSTLLWSGTRGRPPYFPLRADEESMRRLYKAALELCTRAANVDLHTPSLRMGLSVFEYTLQHFETSDALRLVSCSSDLEAIDLTKQGCPRTPLAISCGYKNATEVVAAILARGVSLNLCARHVHPIEEAIESRNSGAMKILLEHSTIEQRESLWVRRALPACQQARFEEGEALIRAFLAREAAETAARECLLASLS